MSRPAVSASLCAATLMVAGALAFAACSTEDEGSGGSPAGDAGGDRRRTVPDGGAEDMPPADQSGGSGDATETDAGGGDLGTTPTVEHVDPECLDGQYREVLPDWTVDVSEDVAAYQESSIEEFAISVLNKRYPVGAWVLQGGLAEADCVQEWIDDSSSGRSVIDELSTLVHECGHELDFDDRGFSEQNFYFTPDVQFDCDGGGVGDTPARGLLNQDQWSSLRPPCDFEWGSPGCDFYADLYLAGDPTDGTFDFGDLGFDFVLEETVQYINSLATDYAFRDFIAGLTSARDGILTHLWYIERYLYLTRNEYPAAYALLTEDQCWREAILTAWGRAWLMIEASNPHPELGWDDAAILDLVLDPVLLNEIALLRQAAGC